jgi:hypothetical protein
MDTMIRHVVIAAEDLANTETDMQITLIESPNIKNIGIGEGNNLIDDMQVLN